MYVLDSHCDTPSQINRLRDMSLDNDHAHVDFPKLRRGGVDGAFFALYVPASLQGDDAYAYSRRLLKCVEDTLSRHPDKARLATSPAQALSNKENGLFSVFIGLENGSPIGDSLQRLQQFYDSGVRYMTLCHSADNQICDSCASKIGKWGGLSPFGKEVVAEMNRIGMLVDVSHLSDDSFWDVLKYSKAPVAATHSCCRSLAAHPRNMTDDMIRALAEAGGVIQINFYPLFIDDSFAGVLDASGIMHRGEMIESQFIADPSDSAKRAAWNAVQDELQSLPRPSYKRIVDHIDHAVSIAGIDHVGIGSDFDGIEVTPEGMDDISFMPLVFEEMRSRGYTEEEIEKVAGGNFLRLLNDVSSCSGE